MKSAPEMLREEAKRLRGHAESSMAEADRLDKMAERKEAEAAAAEIAKTAMIAEYGV